MGNKAKVAQQVSGDKAKTRSKVQASCILIFTLPLSFPISLFSRARSLSLDACMQTGDSQSFATSIDKQPRQPRAFASQHAKACRLWHIHRCNLPALAPAQHLPISRPACLTVSHSCFGAGFTPTRPRPPVPIHGSHFARTIFIPPVGLGFRTKGFRVQGLVFLVYSLEFRVWAQMLMHHVGVAEY